MSVQPLQTESAAPLLHVDGLVKRFGGLTATDHAELRVQPGELHALIGPNGAGKTTLIHQISGALAPDAGRIVFGGDDITRQAMPERVLRGLARSYQITSIFKRLSVLDNVALAVQARQGSSMRFWQAARAERARYAEAAEVVERVGLGAQLHALAGALAHGEQRQLEVGLALATAPRLLLLDEPMAGMGPDESERMVALLQSLRGSTTLLLVEHDMDAVFRLADRISVLVFGRVIACGTPAEIRNHPDVRRAYLGDELPVEAEA
ncbi:ABC transporter ATP-binding protein [Acidovorax sp. Leaf160]|uniref:ABC transporter ATP-binding protein n=1 Tax=Acidovorax sp. Leaf160 TaxID=1736280 RepID=UPI000701E2AB|nr:ABC transporter ATP-binding protein [Acidovorax sp. Leaf160]KQR63228.1 ABC transporter ATP-binding protein [Acidovorax sp. Leaf160]